MNPKHKKAKIFFADENKNNTIELYPSYQIENLQTALKTLELLSYSISQEIIQKSIDNVIRVANERSKNIKTNTPFVAGSRNQMDHFANQKLKKMTLNKEEVLKNAVLIYSPMGFKK